MITEAEKWPWLITSLSYVVQDSYNWAQVILCMTNEDIDSPAKLVTL